MPGDFPPHPTVSDYFHQWRQDGTWQATYETLHRQPAASRVGKSPAASIDSQSVKTIEMGGERGFDGGKEIMGGKRLLLVDTEGFPSAFHVTSASVTERAGA